MSEPEVAQKKSRTRGRLLVLATLVVLLLCCVPFAWRYYRIAAVQNVLNRDYEISFDAEGSPSDWQNQLYNKIDEWLDGTEDTWGRANPEIIYGERVRAMFRGHITGIHIYYHEGIRGDLGAALLRFPELKKLTVFETDTHLADYKLLCQRIRQLPDLEEVELGGAHLSGADLAELAEHPRLKKLNISLSGHLTVDFLQTLQTLPSLQVLEVGEVYGPDEREWESPELLARFRAALPGVVVKLPEPRK